MDWNLINNKSCETLPNNANPSKFNNLKEAQDACDNNIECYGLLTNCFEYIQDDTVNKDNTVNYCDADEFNSSLIEPFNGSLDDCQILCNNKDECQGIVYDNTNNKCVIRGVKCSKKPLGAIKNYEYYRKDKAPETDYKLCSSNIFSSGGNCIIGKKYNYNYRELSKLTHNENKINDDKKKFLLKWIFYYSLFLLVIIILYCVNERLVKYINKQIIK